MKFSETRVIKGFEEVIWSQADIVCSVQIFQAVEKFSLACKQAIEKCI